VETREQELGQVSGAIILGYSVGQVTNTVVAGRILQFTHHYQSDGDSHEQIHDEARRA
jgi:hypothetical protein